MNRKEEYKRFCESDVYIPIFSQHWWMSAVCGEDNWDVILVKKGEEVIGSLVYYVKKKCGINMVVQPPLTQNNGVLIQYPENLKSSKRLSCEKEIVEEVDRELRKRQIDYFNQNFHHSFKNWSPFLWKGYEETTRYTYLLDCGIDIDNIWDNLSKNARKYIRKNSKYDIYKTDDIKIFYDLNKKVFERQGLSIPYSFDFVKNLDDECMKRKSRVMWGVNDKEGNVNCVLYLVYDEKSSYLLMSGTDPENREINLKTSLVWEAIKFSFENGLDFDFEGSMMRNVAHYIGKFGAFPQSYYNIKKAFSRKGKIYKTLGDLKQNLKK